MWYRKTFPFGKMICIVCIVFSMSVKAQEKKTLTLEMAMKMAHESALDAFRAKRQYAVGYWEYRSFQARLLPKVNLDLQPFTFNRSFVQRYDPVNNIDVYRQQRNLNTFGQLSINQNIMATGATVFVNSTFNRFVNFSDDATIKNYSTTPVRIGLNQPLMAFNELKWQNKTAALEYERAKKEYISQQEALNVKTISLFFQWALANTKVLIAVENKKNADRLFKIGQKRYPLGTIERDDLLNLELETFTADTNLAQTEQQLQEVVSELQLFLDQGNLSGFVPELPEVISSMKISLEEAREMVHRYNPGLLDIGIKKINAERDLDRAIKENRFDLSINASYGLNQQADDFANAYSNFLDQQLVAVQFSMPLLDWGERKGNIQKARMNKELADIENKQAENDIEQQLSQKVNNYNLQEGLVAVALRTRNIAEESYTITERRFLSGKVDLLRLLTARRAWQTASENYVQSLQQYWEYYHGVQQMTLYNFMDRSTLNEDFEKLLRR
ncbi:TolC family protein [Maribacter sp. 2304DJ31-5]|uniref:TolC family protein n=1 Tax=Maribacter sp. 2304DJ31-5 TaxID=3386273 RepID=UPI0039BCCD5A